MEHKENKTSIPMELNDDALDHVHGGTYEIPAIFNPGVLMAKHQMNTDAPEEEGTLPVGAITEA